MATPAPTRAQRSETADVVTVLVFGTAAAVAVVVTAWLRFLSMFRDGGFAWTIAVDQVPVDATVDSGAQSVEGIASDLLLIIPNIDSATAKAGAASIIVWALTALIVIAMVMYVAWSFLRGKFFVRSTARAFDVIGWTLVIGAGAVLGLDTMTRNGVLDSIGAGIGEPLHPLDFWAFAPVWAIGIAVGLLGFAFRRGIRLQREMEGLI